MAGRPELRALVLLGSFLKRVFARDYTSQWTGTAWTEPTHKATACRYLGVTGGEHVFTDPVGRCFTVDLVTEQVKISIGLTPACWTHPPSLVAPASRPIFVDRRAS